LVDFGWPSFTSLPPITARGVNKKMEEILKKRMKESVNKDVKIVLQNNFIYAGKVTGCDDTHLEILDYKTNSYHVFNLDNVKDLEVKG